MVSFSIEAEILTIKGRIDAVIKTEDRIFVLEFKTDQSAKKAIEQIKDKKYAEKYANDKLPIVLMGINFDTETRRIDEWVIE